jgi:hypothetical protein
VPEDKGELDSRPRESPDKHAYCHCPCGVLRVRAKAVSAKYRYHIKQNRRQARGGEDFQAVKDALKKRRQRNKDQKGKHQPGKKNRFVKLLHPKKADQQGAEGGARHYRERYKKRKKGKQAGKELFDGLCAVSIAVSVFKQVFLKSGDKGYGDRAFGKEAAEEVGDHERYGKGVGQSCSSQQGGFGHFPCQPQKAGSHGKQG